ncbi:MAG: A/G-specific adenine glycosylase [Thermoprotei archaeon]
MSIIARLVIEWYRSSGSRELPWRKSRDPWHVLLAELLLCRTTTRQVEKIYEELIARYPSPVELSKASVNELYNLLKPLGLHSRAKQLVELAKILVEKYNGKPPCIKEELIRLPGIGEYSASLYLLIVCRKESYPIDSNIARVLSRIYCVFEEYELLKSILKRIAPRNHNEFVELILGLIDLGRIVCKPRKPRCGICPLKNICMKCT